MISDEVLRLIEYCFYILNCVIKCSSNLAISSGGAILLFQQLVNCADKVINKKYTADLGVQAFMTALQSEQRK